jgi:hypothetical protein
MAHDAVGAHARDELGIAEALKARPVQAAFASAGSFAVGAAMPLIVSALAPVATLTISMSGTSLIFLALLGALAAARGRRKCHAERNTRHFLGRAGHGNNRKRRGLVRNCRISATSRYLLLTSSQEGLGKLLLRCSVNHPSLGADSSKATEGTADGVG